MIPISRDVRLTKEFYGVKYSFLPPVGDIELKLISMVGEDEYTKAELTIAYDKALKELEEEYKGKRKPQKKQWEGIITQRMKNYLPDNSNRNIQIMIDTINMVLVGWDADVEFPKDGRPSSLLPVKLMQEISEWYWGQYSLNEDEVKK